jgi:hypothetical protein
MTTPPSPWRVAVRNDDSRAVVTLMCANKVHAVLNLSWREYESLTTDLMKFVVSAAAESIKVRLGQLLWQNAQRDAVWNDASTPGSTPLEAMRGLLEAGWTPDRVKNVGGQLASFVAEALMRVLPKHW